MLGTKKNSLSKIGIGYKMTVILIKLEKWKPFARRLSLKGRSVVVNLLSASKLWHKLNSVSIPDEIINTIQSKFVEKHWISK